MMQRTLGLLALFGLTLGLSGCSEPPYSNIDNARLESLLAQGVPVYDIRRPDEWRQTGVVEGSRKLTFVNAGGRPNPSFLADFSAHVGKHDPVVLICRSGNRSSVLARELMQTHGYTNIFNVKKGIAGWVGEGKPVVRN